MRAESPLRRPNFSPPLRIRTQIPPVPPSRHSSLNLTNSPLINERHLGYAWAPAAPHSTCLNRCKLCDAPVLESTNRRQLASTTSQCCRGVLMCLAIEKLKQRNLGESMNLGTCVQGASTRSRSTSASASEPVRQVRRPPDQYLKKN